LGAAVDDQLLSTMSWMQSEALATDRASRRMR